MNTGHNTPPTSSGSIHARDSVLKRNFDRILNSLVDHPGWAWTIVIGISLLAIAGYRKPEYIKPIVASAALNDELASEGNSGGNPLPEIDPINVMAADAVLVCESDDFFAAEGVAAMRAVVSQLESQPYVRDVMWLDRVPVLNLFGLPQPMLPRGNASQSRYADALAQARRNPLVRGQLMSDDGKVLLVLVHFDFLQVEEDRQCTSGLRSVAEKQVEKFSEIDIRFQVTGRVPIAITALETREKNQLKYQLIGYTMIAVMSLILFRGLPSVLIVASSPAMGVFWTLGIIRFFNFPENPFIDVVLPILVSLVGFTDGVHLMVQIRRNRAEGLPGREAARSGLKTVGLACGLTSLTTAIGFGSLWLAHHSMVREFGLACVVGVVLTFVAVVVCIPLACASPLGRRIHVGQGRGLVDQHLRRIEWIITFVLRRPRTLSGIAIGSTLLFFLISLQLRPDERRANVLPEHSEAALAMQRIDQTLGGLEIGRVEVTWSDAIAADDPQVMAVIREVDQCLANQSELGHPLSIRNLVDALPGGSADGNVMAILELLPPPLKRAFYVPELRIATINFRIQDLGIARYGPVFDQLQQNLDRIQAKHPGFTLSLVGTPVWRWRNLHQILVDLATSLGAAALIIFFVLGLVFRSVRLGLISTIPNLFPLAVAAGWLVVSGQSLEIVSVCAFTVCLGIAVDDTIHFITRYQDETARTSNPSLAIRRAFTSVGTALIITTVVLVAGFSTVLFSDSRDHQIFAMMGAITVTAALFADLVFLPALLVWLGGAKDR